MNRTELRMALRTLSFLDSQAHRPEGFVELSGEPHPKLLVWQPEAIEWIFREDSGLDHPGSRSMRPLLGPHSLLWLDGPRYGTYRTLLGPALGSRRLADFHGLISDAVDRALTELRPGTEFALPEWTRQVTLDIASRILLGADGPPVLRELTAWLERALGSPVRSLAYRLFRGGLPASDPALDRELVRIARAARPPALAALLVDPDGPLGGVGDEELRDQIVSLLFAGHETTASATAWTVCWLDRNPDVRRDVLDELRSTSDSGADANAVPLLQACVRESLRLSPPVLIAGNRRLTGKARLLGRELPRGTVLSPSIYLAHRRPDSFRCPHRFDPGRFLGARLPTQHYLPFGGGARHCPGSGLGLLEARMITAALLRRREPRSVGEKAGVPAIRGHAMAPSRRLRMTVTACHD
ncbi:cytochrome P450 [Prauserella cavernicola]|uniref:Cytochrome P450 n=1 Tax=Prauserella cavernicola TaxID=2800127 RepID=A0A934V787_9PSEU|nr:cytochrome P450 [Prauserella cavernicola]MBK1786985.1 cytochrome P450 [Prauserella cavernicola]